MDDRRFDAFTKRLVGPRTRRDTLRLLGGSLGAGLVGFTGRAAVAAKGSNSACAAFCAQVFGDTQAAGQCTRDAAHGQGLCTQCGPASDGSQTVCGTTCCGSGHECINGGCFLIADGPTCSNCSCGTCAGAVAGSVNPLLCAGLGASTGCASSGDCPAGQACSVNRAKGNFCVAPC